MRTLGLAVVAIAKLSLPGNWRAIVEAASSSPLLGSLARVGLIHEPLVRKRDMRLLVGRNRVAVHVVQGRPDVPVKYVDCSDEEAAMLELAENAHRNHDPVRQAEQTAELLRLFEAQAAQELAAAKELEEPKRGAPKTVRGRARELAAESIGVKPETLRMREYRAEVKLEPREEAELADFPFKTLGMVVSREFVYQCFQVQEHLDDAAKKTSIALIELTRLQKADVPQHKDRLDRIYDDLSAIASALRAMIPVALCPTCKGIDQVQRECAGCRTLGYITRGQEGSIPAELWSEEEPIVYHRGKPRPVSDFAVETPAREDDDPFGLGDSP